MSNPALSNKDDYPAAARKHLHDAQKATTTYAKELNAGSARYAPPIDVTQAPFGGAWTHKLRYRAEGEVAEATARAWVTKAEALYTSTVGAMIRDGVVQR